MPDYGLFDATKNVHSRRKTACNPPKLVNGKLISHLRFEGFDRRTMYEGNRECTHGQTPNQPKKIKPIMLHSNDVIRSLSSYRRSNVTGSQKRRHHISSRQKKDWERKRHRYVKGKSEIERFLSEWTTILCSSPRARGIVLYERSSSKTCVRFRARRERPHTNGMKEKKSW